MFSEEVNYTMEEIKFYNEYEAFGFLSNYYPVIIKIDGITYKSVEHYYQSQKTLDREWIQKITIAETCDEAKKTGNSEDLPRRPDWDTWKLTAMRQGLRAKFTQHQELQEQLLNTGNALLLENSETDYFWGIGREGTGKSMLGKLLMELRNELGSVYNVDTL
jgi:ribA/ribD-fused uncharacterized protein